MNPHLYEGKVLRIENVQQIIPKFSKWEDRVRCCCFRIAYFPEIKTYFLNQWECNCKYPPIVLILFPLSFIAGIWAITEVVSGGYQIALIVIFSLFFIFWFLSYIQCMCRSPGYLPFYWAVERREEYTYEEQMDGIITNDDQFGFAKCNDRPERGALSIQARRHVLRADHVCKWVSNWIGLKNYRFFYLQLFWTFWTFICFFLIVGLEIWRMVEHFKISVPRIMIFVLILPDFGFFVFFIRVFFRHTRYVFHNDTQLAEFKRRGAAVEDKHNYYDLNCCENIQEVCGSCAYCPLYLCPIPIPRVSDGFNWKTNREDNPYKLPEYPKVTEEYCKACPTVEEFNNGKLCPTYEEIEKLHTSKLIQQKNIAASAEKQNDKINDINKKHSKENEDNVVDVEFSDEHTNSGSGIEV